MNRWVNEQTNQWTNESIVHTRVAAEGQFPRGCVRFAQLEVPVFVDAHGGGERVPAGVSEQQVLIAGQHLKHTASVRKHHISWLLMSFMTFTDVTFMSAEQWPIGGALYCLMRGISPGTSAGIRSSRSPTAFRNWMENWDRGYRERHTHTHVNVW